MNADTQHVTQEAGGRGRGGIGIPARHRRPQVLGPRGGAAPPPSPPPGGGPRGRGEGAALKKSLVGSRSPLFESNLETFSFLLCEEEGKTRLISLHITVRAESPETAAGAQRRWAGFRGQFASTSSQPEVWGWSLGDAWPGPRRQVVDSQDGAPH